MSPEPCPCVPVKGPGRQCVGPQNRTVSYSAVGLHPSEALDGSELSQHVLSVNNKAWEIAPDKAVARVWEAPSSLTFHLRERPGAQVRVSQLAFPSPRGHPYPLWASEAERARVCRQLRGNLLSKAPEATSGKAQKRTLSWDRWEERAAGEATCCLQALLQLSCLLRQR